ncbi:MAG: DUF2062 domain-containing protein, partial [Candidatus Omnitrophica bacterium]|nr:DUF2062 domain-containing protein [Candidatus Omnitrophota bacterium]
DGSTDINVTHVLSDEHVVVIKHETNQGKGSALMTGLKYVQKQNGKYAITLDADGQHYPEDIVKMISKIKGQHDLIVIGSRDFSVKNIPSKSKFGRNLSNFWFKVETGLSINDCQSGYRAYPVNYVMQLNLKGHHYDFETEVIAKAAWAGLRIKTVEIGVHYAKEGERISHFKGFWDNLRISRMHTKLVLRKLLPFPNKKLILRKENVIYKKLFKNPFKVLKFLLKENATPIGLAASAAVGIFLAVLPLISIHTIVIIYVTMRLNLNKVMAISIQNLCIPPFVPVACIELGYYMRHGRWLTEVSFHTIFGQFSTRLWEWLLGSLIIAPILSIVVGIVVYIISKLLQDRVNKEVASA